ncbi:MAG: hypothetical protein ABIO04_11625 [Ferruginibacter sp.]
MFSHQEIAFIRHWEMVREKESRFLSKLGRGLPVAMMFGLPIILSVVAVYFFSPEWFTKVSQAATGSVETLVIAVIVIILFFSYFRMHFKWEMNEQLFNELKNREKNTVA